MLRDDSIGPGVRGRPASRAATSSPPRARASRRTRDGCGRSRSRAPPPPDRPRRCMTSARGVKRTRPPRGPQRGAEVHVLLVEEEALVEEAGGRGGVASSSRQAPLTQSTSARRPAGDPSIASPNRRCWRRSARECAWPQLATRASASIRTRPRAGHRASTRRGPAATAPVVVEPVGEDVDRARRHDGVAVEQQHERCARMAKGDVVGGAEAGVPPERHERHARPRVRGWPRRCRRSTRCPRRRPCRGREAAWRRSTRGTPACRRAC